jgi:hypothetical protein
MSFNNLNEWIPGAIFWEGGGPTNHAYRVFMEYPNGILGGFVLSGNQLESMATYSVVIVKKDRIITKTQQKIPMQYQEKKVI